MANEITTVSHNDIGNASLTYPVIIRALTERPGLWRLCREFNLTGDWASPVLSVPVEVSYWGSPGDAGAGVDTEFDGTQATDLANTAATTSAVTCTPGEYGVAHEITDNVREDSLSAIDFFGLIEERMLHVIDLAMTDDFLALLASLSNTVGSSGVDLSIANMIAAFQGHRNRVNDCDATCYVLDKQQATDMESALTSTNAAAAIFALSADRLINYAPSADGGMGTMPGLREIGVFRGKPVYTTGLTDTANAGADVVGAFICPTSANNDTTGATTFGMAWKRLPTVETIRIPLGRSLQVVMSARAGFVELQDGSGTAIITDA